MEHKLYDLRKIQEIAQGDQVFVRDMLVTFVDNVFDDIEKIRSLTSDWVAVAGIAHKLASRFAYLSADSLYALSDDIEKSVLKDNNLTGIADKTNKLCKESILLIEELKRDFDFLCKN